MSNAGDYRASLVRGLVYDDINARFTEIARRADAPFLGASVGEGSLGRDVETLNASARVNDGGIEKGTRGRRPGARSRGAWFRRSRTRPGEEGPGGRTRERINERDKQQTGGLASELVRHFLNAEPAPGIVAELDLSRRFIATITTADAAAVLRDALKDDNRVVIAVSPQKQVFRRLPKPACGRPSMQAQRQPSSPGATTRPDASCSRSIPLRARFGRAVKFPRSASPC